MAEILDAERDGPDSPVKKNKKKRCRKSHNAQKSKKPRIDNEGGDAESDKDDKDFEQSELASRSESGSESDNSIEVMGQTITNKEVRKPVMTLFNIGLR